MSAGHLDKDNKLKNFQKDLYKMLKQCDGSEQSIHKIRTFCLDKPRYTLNVGKLIEDFLDYFNYSLQQKMNVLFILTELLIHDTTKRYIRHLSSRILSFISKYKLEIVDNQDAIRKLAAIFEKWRVKELFSERFYNKLLSQGALFLNSGIRAEYQSTCFKKYSKTLLMAVRDVQKVKATAFLYENYCESTKIRKRIENLRIEQVNIQMQGNPKIKSKAKQLLALTDHLIEQQVKMLTQFRRGNEQLHTIFNKETQILNLQQQNLMKE